MLLILLAISPMMAKNSEALSRNFGLNGVCLKFVLFNNPPYAVLNFKPDGNYTYSGTAPLWQAWMAKKLNFTISYVMLNEKIIKLNGESDFDVAIRMVENKEVDAYVNGLIATPERKAKADMTYFIWTELYSLIVPLPQEESRLFAFIGPFQPIVWQLNLITMLVMVCAMSLFSKLTLKFYNNNDISVTTVTTYPQKEDRALSDYVHSYALYILGIITNQGLYLAVGRLFSFRILVGVWLLVAMVLVNSYSSTIVSFLTLPRTKPSINSLEDLATDESVSILLHIDTLIGQRILNAKSGALKILGDQARHHPEHLYTDHWKASINLANERSAYPWIQTFCRFFIVSQYKKDGICRFKMTDPLPFQAAFFSLAFNKNSKYTLVFDKALMELWESGLFIIWIKSVIPQAPKCFAKTKPKLISTQKDPIGLDDLTGAFFILGIGLSLSTLAYLVEKIIHFKC